MQVGAQWLDDDHTTFTGDNVLPDMQWSTTCRVDTAEPGKEFTFTNLGMDGSVSSCAGRTRSRPAGDGQHHDRALGGAARVRRLLGQRRARLERRGLPRQRGRPHALGHGRDARQHQGRRRGLITRPVNGYHGRMSERDPDAPEPRERRPDDLAHDEVEPDPDQPPGPVPDDEREVPVDDTPDLGDFEGNLNA